MKYTHESLAASLLCRFLCASWECSMGNLWSACYSRHRSKPIILCHPLYPLLVLLVHGTGYIDLEYCLLCLRRALYWSFCWLLRWSDWRTKWWRSGLAIPSCCDSKACSRHLRFLLGGHWLLLYVITMSIGTISKYLSISILDCAHLTIIFTPTG